MKLSPASSHAANAGNVERKGRMMRPQVLMLSMLFLCCALAERVPKPHTVVLSAPQEWIKDRKADANQLTSITIAITQNNLDQLEEKFWKVSDPKSSQYAKYLTLEQANGLVAPTQQSKDAVTQWLRTHGITDHAIAQSGDFIVARASVQRFEQLLGTSFHVYKHATSVNNEIGRELVRALGLYSVPTNVAGYIDFIGGLAYFPKTTSTKTSKHPLADGDIIPSVIKKFFNIDPSTVGTAANNSQAVAQFLQQYYAPSDLAAFQKHFTLPAQPVTKVVGPNQQANPGVEASLDIEYIMATAPEVPTWFVYTDGTYQGQEPFLDWIITMSGTPNAPFVHSISYGDVESSVSDSFKARVNVEFMKYGLVGRSIIFASGDDGTGCDNSCKVFAPNWPASSPYVTSVGGIYLQGNTAIADQIASGGFSNDFPQPSYHLLLTYQRTTAVAAYLSAHSSSPAPTFYNASGRAIPDIASFSENVIIQYDGGLTYVGGTSCAAPVISGVISLLNDARLAAGKEPLGFLNPFLYQTLAAHPDAFTDITQGNNQNGCCKAGFEAAAGWDPITGVGAPNFENLKTYALAV